MNKTEATLLANSLLNSITVDELAKKIGLKPKRRIKFYTSKIDCRLFEYELYAGTKDISKQQV